MDSTGSFRRKLRWIVTSLSRGFPVFLPFEVFFRLLSLAALSPVVAWLISKFIASTGNLALSNEQISAFLLTPTGMAGVIVIVGLTLAIYFAEQAGLLMIAADLTQGRQTSWIRALWVSLKTLPRLVKLGMLQITFLLLASLPFLLLAAATHYLLLSGKDINFFLAERPPAFVIAAGIGILLVSANALVLGYLLCGWFLAIPLLLFDGKSAFSSLRESRRLTEGVRWRIAFSLIVWIVAISSVGVTSDFVLNRLEDGVIASIPDVARILSVSLVAMLTLRILIGSVITIASVVTFSLLTLAFFVERHPERLSPVVGKHMPPRREGLVLWTLIGVAIVTTSFATYRILESLDLERQVKVTAHRGAALLAPENTVSAVRAAIEAGADFAEIDVQQTSDEVVVVLHDIDFMRVASLNRRIWEVDFASLADVDVGSWFSADFASERVPTLREVIRAAKGKIRLNIEIKVTGHGPSLIENVIGDIRAEDFSRDCIVTSLNAEAVAEVRRLAPDIPAGLIVFRSVGNLTRMDVQLLSVNTGAITPEFVQRAHRAHMEVHAWSVSSPATLERLLDIGVDNVITNDPVMVLEYLRQRAEMTDAERLLLALRHRSR